MSQRRGTPIGETAMPAWARSYLSEGQQGLPNRALQWVLMFDQTTYLESSARDVCRRLHIATLGNDDKCAYASQATLARWTGWSEETIRTVLLRLEQDGWLIVELGVGRRPTRYRLAWPKTDPIDRLRDEPELCARPTAEQKLCTRRAGWGTTTPGIGPCKLHGGQPKNREAGPIAPQPLGGSDGPPKPVAPQPLGVEPVDKSTDGITDNRVMPQPLGGSTPTIGPLMPQPLGGTPPMVGPLYVKEYVSVSVESANPGCSDLVAEVEGPHGHRRPQEPDFSLDDVVMADAWRAAARRRLPPGVDPGFLEAYATALAYAEATQGVFQPPAWPTPELRLA